MKRAAYVLCATYRIPPRKAARLLHDDAYPWVGATR